MVAECPHCRLPVLLEERSPVSVPTTEGGAEAGSAAVPEGWVRSERSGRLKRKKRITKKRALEKQHWEEGSSSDLPAREGAKFFVVVLLGLLLLTAGVGVFLKRLVEAEEARVEAIDLEVPVVPGLEEQENRPLEPELRAVRDVEFGKIQSAVERFLQTESPREMVGLIRSRERVEPLLRAYYARHGFEPASFRGIAPMERAGVWGNLYAVTVMLGDSSKRAIAVERTPQGYLVDWESWVGHGELSWADFRRERPTDAVRMRCAVSAVNYYNFAFSDDRRWRSYRLGGDPEGRPLYGYAPAGSAIDLELLDVRKQEGSCSKILELRFPPDATRDDQVIIDKVVADGWVLPD